MPTKTRLLTIVGAHQTGMGVSTFQTILPLADSTQAMPFQSPSCNSAELK
jgi:hypothetical protein